MTLILLQGAGGFGFLIPMLLVFGVFYILLIRHQHRKQKELQSTFAQNIQLGLDLKGGSHLVLRVKIEDYLKRMSEDSATAAQNAAKDAGFDVKEARPVTSGGNYSVVLQIGDASKAKDIRDAVEKKVDLGDRAGWSFSAAGTTLTWILSGATQRTLAESATDQAMKIIESRINAIGVAEPTLQRHGAQNSHEILLQMPGLQDPEHVKLLIGSPSHLELVHVVSPPHGQVNEPQTYASEAEALASLNSGGSIPANRRVLPYAERGSTTGQDSNPNAPKPTRWAVVESPAIID